MRTSGSSGESKSVRIALAEASLVFTRPKSKSRRHRSLRIGHLQVRLKTTPTILVGLSSVIIVKLSCRRPQTGKSSTVANGTRLQVISSLVVFIGTMIGKMKTVDVVCMIIATVFTSARSCRTENSGTSTAAAATALAKATECTDVGSGTGRHR